MSALERPRQQLLPAAQGDLTSTPVEVVRVPREPLDPPMTRELRAEILRSLELEGLELDIDLTLSGKSNVGKNAVADELAAILDIEHWDGSKQLWRRTTEPETGEDRNSPEAHKRFDEGLRQEFGKLRSRRKRKRIFQTRLAAIAFKEASDDRDVAIHHRKIKNARRKQRGLKPFQPISEIRALSILLEASDAERINRAYSDFEEKGIPESQWPSRPELKIMIAQRDNANLEKWRPGHPVYLGDGQDPFDPELTRPNGLPVYDLVEKTDGKTPRQAAISILRRLKEEFNAFRPVTLSVVRPEDHSGVGADVIQGTLALDTPIDLSEEVAHHGGEPMSDRALGPRSFKAL